MGNYWCWDGEIRGIFQITKLLAYRAIPYNKKVFRSMIFIDEEAQRNYIVLRSPRKAEDYKGQQVQKMNYDAFIRTMADLIKKYAPKIQNSEGNVAL